jgi:site-specific DNA-cytosine methylase
MRDMRPLRSVVLFAGGGLLEAGLGDAVQVELAVEFDPKIASHYAVAHGDHVMVADVRALDWTKVNKEFGPIEYLHASPVCKRYSLAKRDRPAEEQPLDLETAKAVADAIQAFYPLVFTLENVPLYRTSTALTFITKVLSRLGYVWDLAVYRADAYGAATRRNRVIIRALRRDLGMLLDIPSGRPKQGWYSRVADLIPTLPESSVPEFMENALLGHGIDWRTVTEPVLVAGATKNPDTIPHAFPREPAHTITAAHDVSRIIMPGGIVLEATPRVLARLMGLPDSYPLPAVKNDAKTIVGNGITVELTEAVILPLINRVRAAIS